MESQPDPDNSHPDPGNSHPIPGSTNASLGTESKGQKKGRNRVGGKSQRFVPGPLAGGALGELGGRKDILAQNKRINRQITKEANTGDVYVLLSTITKFLPQMNSINMVTALHRVTKLVVSGETPLTVADLLQDRQFSQLFHTVSLRISQNLSLHEESEPFEVQCMSIVCWSCATLRLYAADLLSVISEIATPCLWELKPFELSNMVWAYAKLQQGKPKFFEAVSQRMLQRKRGEFSLQCLSMMAWSFASAKVRNTAVFMSLAREIIQGSSRALPQEFANTLWAYAKVLCPSRALFISLADAACNRDLVWMFKPQELSNSVWAFATVVFHHATLFDQVAAAALRKKDQLLPQNTANILWAYAKLQVPNRSNLFRVLLGQTVNSLHKHKPQEISAIVWATAREDFSVRKKFFEEVASHCRNRLGEFPPQALANLVKCFTFVGSCPNFVEAVVREGVRRIAKFDTAALLTLFRGTMHIARRPPKQVSTNKCKDWTVDSLDAMAVQCHARLKGLDNKELLDVHCTHRLLGSGKLTEALSVLNEACTEEMKRRNIQPAVISSTRARRRMGLFIDEHDHDASEQRHEEEGECDDDDDDDDGGISDDSALQWQGMGMDSTEGGDPEGTPDLNQSSQWDLREAEGTYAGYRDQYWEQHDRKDYGWTGRQSWQQEEYDAGTQYDVSYAYGGQAESSRSDMQEQKESWFGHSNNSAWEVGQPPRWSTHDAHGSASWSSPDVLVNAGWSPTWATPVDASWSSANEETRNQQGEATAEALQGEELDPAAEAAEAAAAAITAVWDSQPVLQLSSSIRL
eukprot:TRINITY_DN8259_c0_g1_i1.p1 TRINITY_DN8259_c0_g1~~TRINITY_DN8259_c0_g1_i1.p1  ORF type:complete len:806 (+),score=137.39 TRINITY_DN8259_c0_g1_i1:65-2482(+)